MAIIAIVITRSKIIGLAIKINITITVIVIIVTFAVMLEVVWVVSTIYNDSRSGMHSNDNVNNCWGIGSSRTGHYESLQ